MKNINTVLFTDDFYPNLGGISDILLNLYNQFENQEENLFLFNPYTKGKNLFDTIRLNVNSQEFNNLLKKKNFYKYILLSLWSIMRDIKIPFSERIQLILYLITKPKMFLVIIVDIINLYPILKNMSFDVIIAGNSGLMLPLSFIISRIFRKKLISIAYGNDFLINNSLSLKTFYFRNTEKIVLLTYQTKEIIKKIHHLSDDNLEVIYVGVDISLLKVKETKLEIRKDFNIPDDTFVILSVGRHVQRKNFQLVLRALNMINKLDFRFKSKIKYYLIGDGEETANLKQLTIDLNLEKQVVFLGSFSGNVRNKYYKMSDLFIMPSITKNVDIEGFGVVFLEANYFNLPVIGTATGGMIEAIDNGETGFLIRQNDVNELVDKIMILFNNELLRKTMGKNGFNRVIRDFRWENVIKKYIQLIKELK